MQEVTNPTVGTVNVDLNVITSLKDQITTLNDTVNTVKLTVATKDQVIANLQEKLANNTMVIIKDRYNDIIDTVNIDSVKESLKKDIEKTLGTELVDARARIKVLDETIAQVNADAAERIKLIESNLNNRIDSINQESSKDICNLQTINKDLQESCNREIELIKRDRDLKLEDLTNVLTEAQSRLDDKLQSDSVNAQLNRYQTAIKELEDKFSELNKSGLSRFIKKILFFSRWNKWNEGMILRLNDIISGQPDPVIVNTVLPKSFNEYALKNVYKIGKTEEVATSISTWDPWRKVYVTPTKKIKWVAFDV